ncbi:MAG: hypothetical protein IPJ20_06395 [Flammeovirgaceae bacterium]|nr:hypothetical protein [Flammeovirgaceae bacterium]
MFRGNDVIPSISTLKSEQTLIINRPVLFIACIDMSAILPMEKERIEKMLKSLSGEDQLAYKVYEETEDSIIIGLETEIGLMDVVRSVWTTTAPFKPVKPIRIGLHAAPVYINDTANDHNIDSVKAITQFTTSGGMCTSIAFAAVLALYPKRFLLDYVGLIQLPKTTESTGLFQVNLK